MADTATAAEKPLLNFDFKTTRMERIPLNKIRESAELLRPVDRESAKYKTVAESVKHKGVMQPVLVRELKDPTSGETYYGMVDGNHRFTASLDAGFDDIPANIGDLDEGNVLEAMIIANSARVETTPVQYTRALVKVFSATPTLTRQELANRLDKSVEWLDDRLGLLNLTDELQGHVDGGRIPLASGYALSKLPKDKQSELQDQALSQPATAFCSVADGIRKEILKAKRNGGEANTAKFIPSERLQKTAVIKEQIEALKLGTDVSRIYQEAVGAGVTTVEAAILHTLQWTLHVDPVTLANDEAKWNAEQAHKKAEKERKAAEKERAKLLEAQAANGSA